MIYIYPILRLGYFLLPAIGVRGAEAPLNFKKADATATKNTQNKVLIISNFWA